MARYRFLADSLDKVTQSIKGKRQNLHSTAVKFRVKCLAKGELTSKVTYPSAS